MSASTDDLEKKKQAALAYALGWARGALRRRVGRRFLSPSRFSVSRRHCDESHRRRASDLLRRFRHRLERAPHRCRAAKIQGYDATNKGFWSRSLVMDTTLVWSRDKSWVELQFRARGRTSLDFEPRFCLSSRAGCPALWSVAKVSEGFRAVIGGLWGRFLGKICVLQQTAAPGVVRKKNAWLMIGGRIGLFHGAAVRWGNNEAIQTSGRSGTRTQGWSGSEELGELSCRTGDGCGPESGFLGSKSERACWSCSAQWGN